MIVRLDFSGFLLIKHHIQNGTVIAIPRHIDTDIDPELRSFDLQLCCLLTPLHGNQGIRCALRELSCYADTEASIHVKVDCDGLGVGVYDNLDEQKERIVQAVWEDRCGEAGLDPKDGNQWRDCQDVPELDLHIVECHFGGAGGKVDDDDPIEYVNSTGLMWGAVRQKLKDGLLQIPEDDMLMTQLSNRKYIVNKDGKIELERIIKSKSQSVRHIRGF